MFKVLTGELVASSVRPAVRIQCLSTVVQNQERTKSFRTNEIKPSQHKIGNVGQYYKINSEIKKQLFSHGGIPTSYNTQLKTFAETCLMVRSPALDVINCLQHVDYASSTPKFVLYGQKGNGKSLTLAHILHYGLESDHLLVHVPWVGKWMRSSKEYSNSETREGCVDINLDAAAWLVHFKNQNAVFLQRPDFVTSKEYVWSKRECTSNGAPLAELIDHGISRVKYASECVVALCKEIKKLGTDGKCKVMVAIDGYNAFFYPNTRVFTEKKEMVPPSNVTLTEGFLELTKSDWNNAVCILTVDEIAIAQKDQKSHLPRYLLGKAGFEHLDPFIPVSVDAYSSKELTSTLDYFRERKWIEPVRGQDEELAFLSANNPYKLMQLCGPL